MTGDGDHVLVNDQSGDEAAAPAIIRADRFVCLPGDSDRCKVRRLFRRGSSRSECRGRLKVLHRRAD
jgi:hypothetical protein